VNEVAGKTLTLGIPGKARVIYKSRAEAADCETASEHVQDAKVVWTRTDSSTSIVGRGEKGEIHFIGGFSKKPSLLDALRGIEAYEERKEGTTGLAAIFGAILASERGLSSGLEKVVGSPAFFAHLAEERDESKEEPWSETVLDEKVMHCIDELVTDRTLCRPTAGPLDSARFWLKIGEQLWDPHVISHLCSAHLDGTTRRILVMITGSWMDLKPEGWVMVAGTRLRLVGGSKRQAWPQVMEWEGGQIGRSALKYLTGYKRDYPFDGMLGRLLGNAGKYQEEKRMDPVMVAHESRGLLEETALHWTCDPYGSFRVDIPDRTPLRWWDVTSLRVWIMPREGLWVALEKDEQPGVSFRWTAAPPHIQRWVIQEGAIPAVHLTLSALWRDLKIGGRAVILQEGDVNSSEREGANKATRLHGRITWGSKEELERIIREAYPVEEHIRVLPPGKRASRRAYRRAMTQGIMLKPGTTYVRSHKRGKPDEDVDKVPVKAQGLARLILASRKVPEMQMHINTR
jgi:hypothetical protein